MGPESIFLSVAGNGNEGSYRFTCPSCADDVEKRADRKIVALRAQASQTTALIAALGEERVRDWWSTETFVCADVVESRARTWGTWQVAA